MKRTSIAAFAAAALVLAACNERATSSPVMQTTAARPVGADAALPLPSLPLTTTTTTQPAPQASPAASPSTPPGEAPLPVTRRRLTKLRMTIDSTSAWATVDLLGGSFVQQSPPVVTGGNGASYSSTGFFLQTLDGGRLVVDAVYDAADTNELRVCKNVDGVTSVKLERITDSPTTIATLDDTRTDGGWDADGCADALRQSLDASSLLPTGPWPATRDPRRLTLALYTPWYTAESFRTQQFVDEPVDPYDASTQEGVSGMVGQAAANGVNGFVYWHNGDLESERRLDLVMRAAEQQAGFTVAGELDLGMAGGFDRGSADVGTAESWARSLLSRASSPSYLRVDGRPVLFVWGASDYLAPSLWRQVIDALRAQGFDPFVVADALDPAYGFDGFWVLNANNVTASDELHGWYDRFAQEARVSATRGFGSSPVLWAAGISPGEDDTFSGKPRVRQWYVPREDGARYDAVWQAAADSAPEWMVVSTWNDFHEATFIQQSRWFGRRALDQTKSWTSWFSQQ